MKDHFKQKIDDTRQAYLDALDRLKQGKPTHKDLIGKTIKINATVIALEAGKSRNPLYNTHKDILDMIIESKTIDNQITKNMNEKSEINKLKDKNKKLEEDNRKLLNANATLLFQLKNNFKINL